MEIKFFEFLLKVSEFAPFISFIVAIVIVIFIIGMKKDKNIYSSYSDNYNNTLSNSQRIDNFIKRFSNTCNPKDFNKEFNREFGHYYSKPKTASDTLVTVIIVLMIAGTIITIILTPSSSTSSQKHNSFAQKYNKCVNLYNNRAHGAAKTCVENLKTEYPNNMQVRLFHAENLFKAGEPDGAIEDCKFILKNSNETEITDSAKKLMYKAKEMKRLKRHDIGHYFAELEETYVWKNPRNLKVYISNDFEKGELLKKSFIKWDEALYNVVNFTFVDNPEEAQITARATKRNEVEKICKTGTVGCASNKHYFHKNKPNKKYLKKVEIRVAVNYDDEYLTDDKTFVSITLHEIGHALGIISHSPSIGDVMYRSIETYAADTVTNRDVNTVRRIYGNIL